MSEAGNGRVGLRAPAPVRRTQAGLQTERTILDRALEQFTDVGYDRMSLRSLASAVGIRASSLYAYFPAKSAILERLTTDAVELLEQEQSQARGSLDADALPADRLATFVRTHVFYHAENARQAHIVNSLFDSLTPESRADVVAFRHRYEAELLSIIDDGVAKEHFRLARPSMAAFAILRMGMGVADWYDASGELRPDDIAEDFVEFAVRLVGYRQGADTTEVP